MAEHVIRPKYWAEQITQLASELQPDDLLYVHDLTIKLAVKRMFGVWEGPVGVKVEVLGSTTTCLRCGSFVYGAFCTGCDGQLHAQTCPKLWIAANSRETLTYLRKLNILTDVDPDGPCNCGGDALEHSIRHDPHLVRL